MDGEQTVVTAERAPAITPPTAVPAGGPPLAAPSVGPMGAASVLALQRTAGNAAVARAIATDAIRPVAPQLLREPAPVAAKDADRKREAERLRGHTEGLNRVTSAATSAHAALRSATTSSLASVDAIASTFSDATEHFRMAYGSHQRVVARAEQAAAEAGAIRDAVLGVAIGVVAAFKVVPIIEAVTARKLLVETGGELAELGISKGLDAGVEAVGGEQASPPSLTPEAMELEQARELVTLYRDLAKLQTGPDAASIALACKDVIIEIERYEDGRSRFSAEKIDRFVAALAEKEKQAGEVKEKSAAFQKEVAAKLREVRGKGKVSGPRDMLEDIWTQWLADGGNPHHPIIAKELIELGILSAEGEFADLQYRKGDVLADDAAMASTVRAMRGKTGVAHTDLGPGGKVDVEGQLWQAVASAEIRAGTPVRVSGVSRPDERLAGHGNWVASQTTITLTVVSDEDERPADAG
ncbi:NfeD-like partner-binding protein [Solirubrobacter pauli]|uniref:NfeD-like partner-binding protein n=1 Tax=Solirubrobacter pauli TaxID=166793 RepID=A0A660LBX9_9ACTN|nr:NfeD family protein [Solirubrobacter pauli]RKQ91363.1 NfeD-like partner-binding protein [Solirubrobacter pauli]